jgi:DNA segregation ATPase FtsK/SpoIIIE-like protein
MARDGRHHFLAVFLTGSAGLLLSLCLIPTGQSPNLLGQPGSDISTIFYGGFGLLGWAFPAVFFLAAFALYKGEPLGKPGLKALGLGLGLASACSILHVLTPNVQMFSPSQMRDGVEWGGWLGARLGGKLQSILTSFGTVMVGLLVLVLAAWFLEAEDLVLKAAQTALKAMALGAEWAKTHGFQAVFNLYEKFSKMIESWNARRSEKKVAQAAREKLKTERQAYASVFSGAAAEEKPIAAGSVVFPEPKNEVPRKAKPLKARLPGAESEDMVSAALAEAQGEGTALSRRQQMEAADIDMGAEGDAQGAADKQTEKPKRLVRQWQMPTVHILKTVDDTKEKPFDDFESVSRTIIETLGNFNVEAKVVGVNPGPTVTQYEVQPAAGVKINRISSLADDLALALQCGQVRIVAPIPGKAAVGIEVPNLKGRVVTLKELIAQDDFLSSPKKLLVALGKDISGVSCLANLKEMPHVLIAGSTGSGKSICMNTLVASLLFKASPEEVRLVLIDPKRVEMAVYKDLPHLALPVVTDPKEAHLALKWLVREMEDRYELLARGGVRDIDSYNAKIRKGRDEGSTDDHPMYYIVVLVDELADLMMVAKDQVEESIARLAQMARAVGIHLVLATQRPSVEVITGIIKANFPSRIAFQVFSKVDSRTVLDMNGAEALLGRGDMLYLPSGAPKPLRLQGAYVTLEEIERLVDFWKSQGKPHYTADLTSQKSREVVSEQSEDELYDEAVQIILRSKQASTSLLQRRLKVGYSRAARLLDDMEARGLIGPADGNKPRKILAPVPTDNSLEMEEELETDEKTD